MTRLKTCVLLNGPPGVGKDTIADEIVRQAPKYKKHSFKRHLYEATAKLFKVDLKWLIMVSSDRLKKDTPTPDLYICINDTNINISPRQALIFTSEFYIKPLCGKAHFGNVAANKCISDGAELAVFSDSGFVEEAEPLLNAYENVYVVALHRNEMSFDGDSRSYIHVPGAHHLHIVLRDGHPENDALAILHLIQGMEQAGEVQT